MSDPCNLSRFVDAQNPVFQQVCSELRAGRKEGHWMWFIFPQLRGLGHSWMAQHYGIASREEGAEYLRHSILGARLRECTALVNIVEGKSAEEIFGYTDSLKFRSSMTLFGHLGGDDELFAKALQKYFGGKPDHRTLSLL
jgi:uncharacterized protein (DUF1810 family)